MNDNAALVHAIRHVVPLNAQEESFVNSLFETDTLPAGEFFLQVGQVCRHVGFVTQGLLRYYVLDDGEEHTYDFSPDYTFTCNYESFLNASPSTRFIQAMEDTRLLRISYENLQRLYEGLEHGQKFGRLVAEQLFVSHLQKLTSFYRDTADQRYDHFMRVFPGLIDRVPQYVVASYVGIKPQSLSRIRAQRAGKHY